MRFKIARAVLIALVGTGAYLVGSRRLHSTSRITPSTRAAKARRRRRHDARAREREVLPGPGFVFLVVVTKAASEHRHRARRPDGRSRMSTS